MKKIFTFLLALMFVSAISKAQSGITWAAPMTVASNNYQNLHPRITLDAMGNPLILWGYTINTTEGKAYFSRWNGSMFTTPVTVSPNMITIAAASWMGPDIASKGDTVYVVMKRTDEGVDTNRLFITHSFDGGMTFSIPVQIGYISDSVSRFPTVSIDETGNPIVGFMKFDAGYVTSQWWISRSTDYGTTFLPCVKASGWSGGDVCDCCPGALVKSGNTLAMLYRDKNSNIRDSWAGISNDEGTTFPSGIRVDQNNWNLNMCPSSGPDGVIIGDTLYSSFMNGASGTSLVYYNKSSISNLTSGPTIPVTGMYTGLFVQNYPRMANNGNAIALAWKQNVSGSDQLGILFTNNINNGFPTLFDTVWTNNITNTDVAVGNGEIHVVWQDDNAGVVRYRKGTFISSTSVDSDIPNGNFSPSIYPNPANTILNIHKSSNTLNETLVITDVFGREIFKKSINISDVKIDVSKWDAGVYNLELMGEKTSMSSKFIKY